RAGQPRTGRHILERSVAAIAVQAVLSPRRHEEIIAAVVVVIRGARALSPAGLSNPGARGHIFKRSVAPLSIEMAHRSFGGRKTFERCAVDEEYVQPSVTIDIEYGDAAASRLEQIAVRACAAVNREMIPACRLPIFRERKTDRVACRFVTREDHPEENADDEQRRVEGGIAEAVHDGFNGDPQAAASTAQACAP